MKKIIIPILFLLLVTGCGGSSDKYLTCTRTTYDDGMRIYTEVIGGFDGDVMTEVDLQFRYELENEYRAYIDDIERGLKEDYREIANERGVTFSTEKDDDVINVTLSGDFTTMDDDTKEYFDMIPTDLTFEEYQTKMQELGYECDDD